MKNATIKALVQSFEAIPPLELEAVRLLSELRPQAGEWFPADLTPDTRQQVIAATVELAAYTQRCADMARRLSYLQAVPLRTSLTEFGL